MRKLNWFTLLFAAGLFTCVHAQTDLPLRYFEFRLNCGHGNWQDTSVIAAASDSVLIAEFYAELAKPFHERKQINGPLAHGDGGHNRNGDHAFRWHFEPDAWELVDLAFEACSGCPFTDLDADPVYWVDSLGNFCPWTARPAREVQLTTSTGPRPEPAITAQLYPNPVRSVLNVDLMPTENARALLRNALGRVVLESPLYGVGNRLRLTGLPTGMYTMELVGPGRARSQYRIFLQ